MILGKGDMDFLKCGMPTYLTEEQYGSAVSCPSVLNFQISRPMFVALLYQG